ncbi:MAG TPA: hypothetical protein VMI31_01485 [Fimbriimonadaceae bacterium]|nr:hypothetical protein [Fimbriimonadaceae bacterium]
MLLLTCYLASATLFYFIVARSAPVLEEPYPTHAPQGVQGEVIEIFTEAAEQPASRAA